jgi:hypothetical protein
MAVEDVAAFEVQTRCISQGLRVANHAEVVSCMLIVTIGASILQARHAIRMLTRAAMAKVTARLDGGARLGALCDAL